MPPRCRGWTARRCPSPTTTPSACARTRSRCQRNCAPCPPLRRGRAAPGDPDKCPVWKFHEIYSGDEVKKWVQRGCRSAGIGCLECKQPVIDAVLKELKPIRERSLEYQRDPDNVRAILDKGCEKARDVARETLEDVREAMGLVYR